MGFGLDQNVAITADPYVEESHDEIASDVSRDSFLPEQLPEASFELEPTKPGPPRTIETRTQTALEQGIPRRRFSHFGYHSDSESEQEVTEPPILDPGMQVVFPELDDLQPLFSDQEGIQPEAPTRSLIPSPLGSTAPLLSNPSLVDTLNNFPLFSPQTKSPSDPEPLVEAEQPQEPERENGIQDPNPNQLPAQPNTSNRRGRQRSRPPNRRREHTSRTTASSKEPITLPRRSPTTRVSTRAPLRTLDRAMTLHKIPENHSPDQP